jgi:hypothetical protein
MLIDFSDLLSVNVYTLGAVYLQVGQSFLHQNVSRLRGMWLPEISVVD